jgi:hypothetical protein
MRPLAALSLVLCIVYGCSAPAGAQALLNARSSDDQVLDVLLTPELPASYTMLLSLRFQEPLVEQLTVIVQPGGKSEVIYTKASVSPKDLYERIMTMSSANPALTPRAIAAGIPSSTQKTSLAYRVVDEAVNDLMSVRVSPALVNRVVLHDNRQYEFWYETGGQEQVHFKLAGAVDPDVEQDKLKEWMLALRGRLLLAFSSLDKKR